MYERALAASGLPVRKNGEVWVAWCSEQPEAPLPGEKLPAGKVVRYDAHISHLLLVMADQHRLDQVVRHYQMVIVETDGAVRSLDAVYTSDVVHGWTRRIRHKLAVYLGQVAAAVDLVPAPVDDEDMGVQ